MVNKPWYIYTYIYVLDHLNAYGLFVFINKCILISLFPFFFSWVMDGMNGNQIETVIEEIMVGETVVVETVENVSKKEFAKIKWFVFLDILKSM